MYGNYYGSNCLIEKSTGEFSGTSVFSSLSRKHPLFGCPLSQSKRAKFSEDQFKTVTSITRPLVCSPRVTDQQNSLLTVDRNSLNLTYMDFGILIIRYCLSNRHLFQETKKRLLVSAVSILGHAPRDEMGNPLSRIKDRLFCILTAIQTK